MLHVPGVSLLVGQDGGPEGGGQAPPQLPGRLRLRGVPLPGGDGAPGGAGVARQVLTLLQGEVRRGPLVEANRKELNFILILCGGNQVTGQE